MERSLFDIHDRNETINLLIDTLNTFITSYNSNMSSIINEYNTNTRTILSLVEHLINITNNDLNNTVPQPRTTTYRRNVNTRRTTQPYTTSIGRSTGNIRRRYNFQTPRTTGDIISQNNQEDDTMLIRERTTSVISDINSNIEEDNLDTTIPRRESPPIRQQPYIRIDRQNVRENEELLRDLIRTARSVGTNYVGRLPSMNDDLIRNRILTEDRTNLFQMDTLTDIITQQFSNLQDVPVFPTQEQIENATQEYNYNIDNNENINRCPITMENFEEGDEVLKIIPCGHLFKKEALLTWFQTNVRCPVCRYDIREYHVNHIGEISEDLSSNVINTIGSNLIRTTSNTSRTTPVFSTNVFSFDIPIIINGYDPSDNIL